MNYSMTPSQDQIWGIVRQLIPIIGTIVAALGWVPQSVVDVWVQQLLAISGPVIILIGMVLSLRANTRSSIIQSAAGMPENKVEAVTGKIAIVLGDTNLQRDAVDAHQRKAA